MANKAREQLLSEIARHLGAFRLLPHSRSMIAVGKDAARIYLRYSKTHQQSRAFFGLREVDLRGLEGHNSFIALYTDDGSLPVYLPFAAFEQVFHAAKPASDGQYKVQLLREGGTTEIYVPKMGRFNVDGYTGLETVQQSIEADRLRDRLTLSHCQVQTLLGAIGVLKGYEVFVPAADACSLDWSVAPRFAVRADVPSGFDSVRPILSEVDVLWIVSGANRVEGLFEVEHSTPIYSGLLRFNDVLLNNPSLSRFYIVSNEDRRDLFARQLARPTFCRSGLSELTSFLEYANVAAWYSRAQKGTGNG